MGIRVIVRILATYTYQFVALELLLLVTVFAIGILIVLVTMIALDNRAQIGITVVDILGHLNLAAVLPQDSHIQAEGLQLL